MCRTTEAPGITAPELSCTVPLMVAVETCAGALAANESQIPTSRNTTNCSDVNNKVHRCRRGNDVPSHTRLGEQCKKQISGRNKLRADAYGEFMSKSSLHTKIGLIVGDHGRSLKLPRTPTPALFQQRGQIVRKEENPDQFAQAWSPHSVY